MRAQLALTLRWCATRTPTRRHGRMLKGLGRSSGPPLLLCNGTVRPQPPDGSCLFHSLCFGLSRIAAARNVPHLFV